MDQVEDLEAAQEEVPVAARQEEAMEALEEEDLDGDRRHRREEVGAEAAREGDAVCQAA